MVEWHSTLICPEDLHRRGQERVGDHVWKISRTENCCTRAACEPITGWQAACGRTRAGHWRDVSQYHPRVPSSSVLGCETGSLADALLNNKIFFKLLFRIFWLRSCELNNLEIYEDVAHQSGLCCTNQSSLLKSRNVIFLFSLRNPIKYRF